MLFIRSFKRLSWLNLVGFISTLVVTATMVLLILLDPFREDMPKVHSLPTPTSSIPYAPLSPVHAPGALKKQKLAYTR